MKRFVFFVLLLFTGWFAYAQTPAQLIDSARYYKSKDYSKVISFSAAAYKQSLANKQFDIAGQGAFLCGVGHYLAGNFDMTLHWYFESERLYARIDDTIGMAELYADMCVFYVKLKKYPEADIVSKKAIALARAIHNNVRLAPAVNNRGLLFLDEGKIDSAVNSFRSSYFLYKSVNDKTGMAYSRDYLASALTEKGRYPQALQAMNESRQLRQGIGDKTGEAIAINNIGELYLKEKNPSAATPYFLEAIKKAHELNYPDFEIYVYNMLSQTYEQQGKYPEAYRAQNKYIELNQKFQDDKHTRVVEELQTKYETNKKEQQNKLLQVQNNEQRVKLSRNRLGMYASLAIALLAILLFYLLYNKYKLKQQARLKEVLLEDERLRAKGILEAEENERQRLARELHDGVGQLLCATRRNVEVSQNNNGRGPDKEILKMLDDSIKEVRDMSHNMMPPYLLNKNLTQAIEDFLCQMNSEELLTIHTDWVNASDLELDKTTTLMLYRSTQEIISNIFRHACATSIHIELVNHDTALILMIYDDGIGFDKEELLRTGKGLGLKNIQSRIAYAGGSLQIDTMPGKGVTYIIDIPFSTAC